MWRTMLQLHLQLHPENLCIMKTWESMDDPGGMWKVKSTAFKSGDEAVLRTVNLSCAIRLAKLTPVSFVTLVTGVCDRGVRWWQIMRLRFNSSLAFLHALSLSLSFNCLNDPPWHALMSYSHYDAVLREAGKGLPHLLLSSLSHPYSMHSSLLTSLIDDAISSTFHLSWAHL